MNESFKVIDKVEIFPQKGGWYFIRVPISITEKLAHKAERGVIAINATIGKSSWKTSLLPMGDGTHFIALNACDHVVTIRQIGDVGSLNVAVSASIAMYELNRHFN